jgi:hypothetical protein
MSETPLGERVRDTVHAETQVRPGGVDLTAAAVYRVDSPGRLDFGGGEYAPADREPVDTALRNPDDDYGWWTLAGGPYLVEFNESLAGDEPVRVEPRRELLTCGATLPTVTTATFDPLPLVAPRVDDDPGIRIKENARVATVVRP